MGSSCRAQNLLTQEKSFSLLRPFLFGSNRGKTLASSTQSKRVDFRHPWLYRKMPASNLGRLLRPCFEGNMPVCYRFLKICHSVGLAELGAVEDHSTFNYAYRELLAFRTYDIMGRVAFCGGCLKCKFQIELFLMELSGLRVLCKWLLPHSELSDIGILCSFQLGCYTFWFPKLCVCLCV